MNLGLRKIIKHTFLYHTIAYLREKRELRDWKRTGKPIPPPHLVKVRIVEQYAKKFSTHILVETGTYLGEMVNATKDTFSKIFSIELDQTLYEQAKISFSTFGHISILHGDSSWLLSNILATIERPCLFWLDAHYSGGITAKGTTNTPIIRELRSILDHPVVGHVVLIDDARCFVGSDGYPTVDQLQDLVFEKRSDLTLEVRNDIIRIHQKVRSGGTPTTFSRLLDSGPRKVQY